MNRLYGYLILINIITFFVWGYDKWMARINGIRLEKAEETRESQEYARVKIPTKRRISEKKLLILAALGGGIGTLLAMSAYRHKTKKGKFLWKLLCIIFIELVIILFIVRK